jgi:hypothetical protein
MTQINPMNTRRILTSRLIPPTSMTGSITLVAGLALAASSAASADVANGTCSTATAISGSVLVPVGLASAQVDALPDPCLLNGLFHSCWYRFTAPSTGSLNLFTNFAGQVPLDTQLLVYTGCNAELLLDCSSSAVKCGSCASVEFPTEAGATYYIAVGTSAPTTSPAAAIYLSFSFQPAPESCGAPQSCCLGQAAPGCSDENCCNVVCISDPVCCQETWDANCASIATDLCNDICTNDDCNGNGEPDSKEFGPNSHVAVPFVASTGNPYDWCPPLEEYKGAPLPLLVVNGMPLGGQRSVTIPYQAQVETSGFYAVDTRAALFAADGTSSLSLGPNGMYVGPQSEPGPTSLVVSDIHITSNGLVTVGALPPSDTDADRSGELVIAGSSTISGGGISVVDGTLELLSGPVFVDTAEVLEDGVMKVGDGVAFSSAEDCEISGSLVLDGGIVSIAPSKSGGAALIGTPRALLTGGGSIYGQVRWAGVVAPNPALFLGNSLLFRKPNGQPADDAKLAISLEQGAFVSVMGIADLHGTLFVDATGYEPQLGQVIPFLYSNGFASDRFDSVQFRGLPANIGAFVVPYGGGQLAGQATSGLGVVFVPLANIIDFGDSSASPLPARPTDAVRADFNDDGIEDLAVCLTRGATESGDIVVFLGTGKGLVQDSILTIGRDPSGIATADFNGDLKPDLVVSLFGDDAIQVIRNESNAGGVSFDALSPVPVGAGPVDVAVGDFLPDAALVGTRTDVVVALSKDASFKIVKNQGGEISGSTTEEVPSDGGLPTSVGGGDVDNDRDDDVVGGSTGGTTIIPGGSSTSDAFGGTIFIPSPNPVTDLKVADLSGDGVPEIVATLNATGPRPGPPGSPTIYDSLTIIRANGPGFSSALLDFWLNARAPAIGDFDGDGDSDFAITSRNTLDGPKRARIIRNDSTPTNAEFNLVATLPELGEPDVLVAISIDGVGDDILSAEQVTQGDVAGRITLLRTANPAAPGDLDGDGVIGAGDLAILFQYWGLPGIGDIDGNGTTDGFDLTILLGAWSSGG